MSNMKDVAELAGVSVATVSNVINDSRFVAEPTKKKVIESMDKLNYTPNKVARSLKNKESKTIGFILPDISNFFFAEVTQFIEKKLKEYGYSLIISSSDESIEKEKEQIDILNSHQIDGLILAPARGDHSYLEEIRDNNELPIIFIDRKPEGIKGTSILTENYLGAYQAIEYLINKGHKNIGIIAGLRGITSTTERLAGYKQALRDNNIEIYDDYIKFGDSRYESGHDIAEGLTKNKEITAIFAANNLMATGAMTYLSKNNFRIPEELAIISFDDFKWAEITSPSLTSIKQKSKKIGHKAAETLINEIENKIYQHESNKVIRVESEFIIRKSC